MQHRDLSLSLQRACHSTDWSRIEHAVWAAFFIFYILGDVVTTILSLELGGIETNPFAVEFYTILGYPGLVVLKLLMLGVVVAASLPITVLGRKPRTNPAPFRIVIVGMFAFRGVALTAWNSYVIYRWYRRMPRGLTRG